MTSKYVERLAFAAHKAAARPEFLAFFLKDYQRQEGLSEDDLQRFLGCTAEGYYRLALCMTPDLQADDFGRRIERIASSVGVSASNLARVVRQVAAVRSLEKAARAIPQIRPRAGKRQAGELPRMDWAGRSDSVLLAARDRETEEKKEDSAAGNKHKEDQG